MPGRFTYMAYCIAGVSCVCSLFQYSQLMGLGQANAVILPLHVQTYSYTGLL